MRGGGERGAGSDKRLNRSTIRISVDEYAVVPTDRKNLPVA